MEGSKRAGRDPSAGPPRLWTVPEANARLPGLQELLPRLRGWAGRLVQVQEEQERLSAFWGTETGAKDQPDHDLTDRLDAESKRLTHGIEEAVEALRAEGIEVKDLGTGLVDFYSMEGGELVLLCWQRGEPEVAYYHPLTGGYRSRRPISELNRAAPARASRPL